MEYLCAKISQLCCFLKIQLAYGIGLVYHSRIVVVHAVDVGPYLYLFNLKSCTYKRGGIVRTSTLQIIHLAICVPADKTLGDIYLIALILSHQCC